MANILLKASKRLYLLKQLKRANAVDTNSLTKGLTSVLEDRSDTGTVPLFHSGLPIIIYQKKSNEFRKEA